MASAALAYPGLQWREVPLARAAFDETELEALADAIDDVVPAWQSLRVYDDGSATLHLEAQFGETIGDTASSRLEVCFSPVGRYATLREVQVIIEENVRREMPILGISDTRWAGCVKALQGLLRARAVTLLDMAFLSTPVSESVQTAYELRYEVPLTWWSLLFRPEPPSSLLACDAVAMGATDATVATVATVATGARPEAVTPPRPLVLAR